MHSCVSRDFIFLLLIDQMGINLLHRAHCFSFTHLNDPVNLDHVKIQNQIRKCALFSQEYVRLCNDS